MKETKNRDEVQTETPLTESGAEMQTDTQIKTPPTEAVTEMPIKTADKTATEAAAEIPTEEAATGAEPKVQTEKKNVTLKEDENAGDTSDDGLVPVDLKEEKPRVRKRIPKEKTEKKPMDPYRKKRRNKVIRLFVILLLLALLGLLVYFKVVKPAQEKAQELLNSLGLETDTIERRDIVDSITTTGNVQSNLSRDLSVNVPSDGVVATTVDSVLVNVGDRVKKGDVLVIFSSYYTLDQTIENLKKDLNEQYQRDSIEARSNDRTYLYSYAKQATELQNAASDVDTALKNLYEACDGYGSAKRELQKAIDEGKSEQEIQSLRSGVSSAYEREQSAQNAYNKAVQAQANTISKTNNTLTEADENHELKALDRGDQARSIKQKIEDAERQKETGIVTAPFDGVITAINVQEGNTCGGGSILTIQDTGKLRISAQIDEYDIPDVRFGQYCVIRTDALPDVEMDGVITFIAPTSTAATTSTGAEATATSTAASNPTYEIKIDIVNPNERLKLGMTAKLNIVTKEVLGVLTVPYDAITTNVQGENVITVVDESALIIANSADEEENESGSTPVITINGKEDAKAGAKVPQDARTREIPITIGMEGDYYTEIRSGAIREGMIVVLPNTNNVNSLEEMMRVNMSQGGF